MINFKFIKRRKVFKKGGLHVNPDVYWNAVQIIASGLVLFAFAYGFFLFQQVNREFIFEAEDFNGEAGVLSEERLRAALEYYAEKANNAQRIVSSSSPVVDPSR